MMNKLYMAYGSNMNLQQMRRRCPTAKVVGNTCLEGYELLFRGGACGAVATVEPKPGATVPVVLWRITPADEAALDCYEGYPYLYRKETLSVVFEEQPVTAMVYIMNAGRSIGLPGEGYFETILEGYEENNLDPDPLFEACFQCIDRMR